MVGWEFSAVQPANRLEHKKILQATKWEGMIEVLEIGGFWVCSRSSLSFLLKVVLG